jgi:hypothetical protein
VGRLKPAAPFAFERPAPPVRGVLLWPPAQARSDVTCGSAATLIALWPKPG